MLRLNMYGIRFGNAQEWLTGINSNNNKPAVVEDLREKM